MLHSLAPVVTKDVPDDRRVVLRFTIVNEVGVFFVLLVDDEIIQLLVELLVTLYNPTLLLCKREKRVDYKSPCKM